MKSLELGFQISMCSKVYIDSYIEISSKILKIFNERRIHIVCDETVFDLYVDEFASSIPNLSCTVLECGELSKSQDNLDKIYEDMYKNSISRSDVIVGFGGGVICDIAAFASAIYLRGVELCLVPTTLLCQVDAAIGGKCGINTRFGKNSIGCFYPANKIFVSTHFLKSLPPNILLDGIAEIIKYGLTFDRSLLKFQTRKSNLIEYIEKCIKIKSDICKKDICDRSYRQILNFGHTIGHAVERLGGFLEFSHGQAISIGIIYALKLSELILNFPHELIERIDRILTSDGFCTTCPYTSEDMLDVIFDDKKRHGQIINFILLEDVEKPKIVPLSIHDLKKYMNML